MGNSSSPVPIEDVPSEPATIVPVPVPASTIAVSPSPSGGFTRPWLDASLPAPPMAPSAPALAPGAADARPPVDLRDPQTVAHVAEQRSADLRIGSHVGRYELLAIVASGGMGRVWAGRAIGQHGFKRFVAMKTILPSLVHSEELRARFFDEATLAAKIHHPNVCQILDLGEAEGLPYMVLEWIDGAPLSELYTTDMTPLDPRAAARIMVQVCAGLHAAHEVLGDDGEHLGLVHRDVSPQNIMVGEGLVKVTDFGIAKAIGRSLTTQAGQVRGKAPYLAPEQLTAGLVDRRTDVYAAGALLYEVATATRAYDGETDAIILVKVMNGSPRPPREIVPGFPEGLAAVITRAMSRDPNNRYPTAQAMQRALEDYLARAQPLSDSVLARIVTERVGSEILERRERVRRSLATLEGRSRPSMPSLPSLPALALIPTLDASSLVPIEESGTSLPLGAVLPPPPSSSAPLLLEAPELPVPELAPIHRRQAPGFLDPAALAAARGGFSSAPPPAPSLDQEDGYNVSPPGKPRENHVDLMEEALERQREYMRAVASRAGTETETDGGATARSPALRAIVLAVLAVGLVVTALLLAPVYARQRVGRAAQDAGLSLTMGDLSVSATGLTLRDVKVTATMLGDVQLEGATVRLTPLFSPTAIDVTGGTLRAQGSFDTLRAKARAFRDNAPDLVGQKTTLDSTKLVWTGALPDDMVIQADGLHAEADAGGASLALHTPALRAAGAHGAFGPWGFDLATANDGITMHVLLDPSAPQGATMTFFSPTAKDSPSSLSARIARASLSHLGISAALLGLEPDEATQLEMDMQILGSVPAHLRADLRFVVHDARPVGTQTPLDITFAANANGSAAGPVPLHVTQLLIGPISAHADAVIAFDDGLRIDGTWSAHMTCEQLAKAAGQDTFGLGSSQTPLGKLLGGVKSGATAGERSLDVEGLVTFDTRAPDRIRFAPTFAATCGVPLLTKAAPR